MTEKYSGIDRDKIALGGTRKYDMTLTIDDENDEQQVFDAEIEYWSHPGYRATWETPEEPPEFEIQKITDNATGEDITELFDIEEVTKEVLEQMQKDYEDQAYDYRGFRRGRRW